LITFYWIVWGSVVETLDYVLEIRVTMKDGKTFSQGHRLPISCSVKGRGKKRAKKEDKHKKEGLDQQESSTQEALF